MLWFFQQPSYIHKTSRKKKETNLTFTHTFRSHSTLTKAKAVKERQTSSEASIKRDWRCFLPQIITDIASPFSKQTTPNETSFHWRERCMKKGTSDEKRSWKRKKRMINDCSKIIKPFDRTLAAIHPPPFFTIHNPLCSSLTTDRLVLIVFSITSRSNETDIPKQEGPHRDRATHRREIGFRLRLPD